VAVAAATIVAAAAVAGVGAETIKSIYKTNKFPVYYRPGIFIGESAMTEMKAPPFMPIKSCDIRREIVGCACAKKTVI
jgi:hypothetical protein